MGWGVTHIHPARLAQRRWGLPGAVCVTYWWSDALWQHSGNTEPPESDSGTPSVRARARVVPCMLSVSADSCRTRRKARASSTSWGSLVRAQERPFQRNPASSAGFGVFLYWSLRPADPFCEQLVDVLEPFDEARCSPRCAVAERWRWREGCAAPASVTHRTSLQAQDASDVPLAKRASCASSSARMRSVFPRIAVMFMNTHFGGAVSGIAAILSAKSTFRSLSASSLVINTPPATIAPTTTSFFT